MGKKGGWFSAIKKFCTSNSKQKPVNEAEKKRLKEKKGLKHGIGNRSFIPLFREPSSIEKILGEVDQQNIYIPQSHHHPIPKQPEEAQPSGRPQSPRPPSPKAAPAPSPRVVVDEETKIQSKPEPSLQQPHLSATKIQAAYRGYMARRKLKLRGSTGLVRLQGVVRGQHVKRQTVNAMKQMQLLVRLQTQIQSQRMQTIENQALKRQPQPQVAKNQLDMGDEDWDDSVITKEEREARLRRKMEALNKRERAMAYAHSRQLLKGTPKSAQNTLMGYPWWWNWLDRELPSNTQIGKNHEFTATQSPQSSRQKQTIRPSSSTSTSTTRQQKMTPTSTTPPSRMMKFSKARGDSASASASPYPMKDDDSLMSCPPFSGPNYMSPTLSAKAKARPTSSNPRDRMPGTPGSVSSQRRFSFPATPNSRGSAKSVGDFSVDSAFSIGRKPFNRFV
ncbi:hypothetical protein LXL04_003918 [Taraxacum kok-saghyz]